MESWTSYMIEGTKIRLLNNTTKNIEDLTTNDELIVMNASDPSFDAANLQHNPREGGFATNVIKKEFSLNPKTTGTFDEFNFDRLIKFEFLSK